MNLLQIKHQLKSGQKQFTDKTVKLLITEIEKLQQQVREQEMLVKSDDSDLGESPMQIRSYLIP